MERTPAIPDLLDAMGLPGLNRSVVAAAMVGKSMPETTAVGRFSPAERKTEREATLSPRLKPGARPPKVKITEESYTSMASFLDADPLPVYGAADIPPFSGRRVKRALYRAANGRRINADVNGAYNTIRKVLPDSFGQGIAGTAVCPVRLAVRTERVA